MNLQIAQSYVHALTGSADTPMAWRAIHDTDRGVEARNFDGPLDQVWPTLMQWNAAGYGIFAVPAVLDGQGRTLDHVAAIRAHYIDLDTGSVEANAARAAASLPAPCFAVSSSPGKVHTYWPIRPLYRDNERFQTMQRKLAQEFGGDPKIIDATRVMRLPGTWNRKYGEPHLVTCHALPGYLQPTTIEALEAAYAHVQVIETGGGTRHDLGDPALAAPSLEWIRHALHLMDPNQMDRDAWIATTCAIKQSGATLADPDTLFAIWSEWCSQYGQNDLAENQKQWNSIRQTQLGWPSLVARLPTLRASIMLGPDGPSLPAKPTAVPIAGAPPMPVTVNAPPPLDCSGEMLTHIEQADYFKGCTWVTKLGKIMVPDGRFLNQTQFNGEFGGKLFICTSAGKTTDQPWKAALHGTQWRVPKVDHLRFLPHEPAGAIVNDDLGRKGINTYLPSPGRRIEGDASPFLRHVAAILPDENDQMILLRWIAHNIKYPGYKIPWAPVIQSAEGVGKGVIKSLMLHALGQSYTHYPNAQELTNSGSQFNGWIRNKLFILADEIKVDDRRDLIEVLKPLISERLIEVQSKGIDQELEDNYANWLFFTNFKDAVPISKNGRRYAIFYSQLQTEQEILSRGMDESYFNQLYAWIDGDGAAIVTDWFHRWELTRGDIPMRAPKTSSWNEAVTIGRSPVERVITEAAQDNVPGFIGGWVSVLSAMKRARAHGAVRGHLPPHVVAGVLESMGYHHAGRAPRPFHQDDPDQRSELYHRDAGVDVDLFGRVQGWE